MPAKEQLTWGPGDHWELTHADIDTLLSTRIPETYPDSYKVVFTMENAYEVLSQHNPNKFFDYPHGRLEKALDDLLRYEKPYVDNWDSRKMSNHPHLDNLTRQSRASDHFKAMLKAWFDGKPQVVKHECIPEVTIRRLCVGLRGGYTNVDIGKSFNELYKRNEHLPEYVKYGVIRKGEMKRMQLYLCLYENCDYGKWMAMSESESAFRMRGRNSRKILQIEERDFRFSQRRAFVFLLLRVREELCDRQEFSIYQVDPLLSGAFDLSGECILSRAFI